MATKAEKFLHRVLYRVRRDQYELRRRAQKALDALDDFMPKDREGACAVAELGEFLTLLDEYDRKAYLSILDSCEEADVAERMADTGQ